MMLEYHLYVLLRHQDTRLQSNYHDVETLMKTLLAEPSLTEAKLRQHLKTYLQLSSLWEPSTGILVILWEYYYKRLVSEIILIEPRHAKTCFLHIREKKTQISAWIVQTLYFLSPKCQIRIKN